MKSDGQRRKISPRKTPPVIDLHGEDREPTTDAKGRVWPPIPDAALPVDIVLPRLDWVTQRSPNQWTACCPSHPDSRPSCSITERSDRALLVHCFSGSKCDAETICAALGLSVAHLYPTPYALRRRGTQRSAIGSAPVSSDVDPSAPPDPAMKRLARECRRHPERAFKIQDLAHTLGVTVESLKALGVGWSSVRDGRWAIPEYDDQRRVVGVSYRHPDGLPTSAKGGHRGLILPRDLGGNEPVYACEGMSDTAAMLSAGRRALGRPAAQVSALVRAWLARLILAEFNGRRVVVVGDRDDAGVTGARDLADWLANECGRSVVLALPPLKYKDVREQWTATGTVRLMVQGGRT